MAEQLRETIRNYKFVWEERTFRLGCSVGVVPITGDSEDVAALLSAADSACEAAKEAGRNRVYSFQENDIDLMRRRREMQWAARINNALEESRFELYRMTIQPLQKPDPGAHYELLLRMKDEQGKIVSPDNFIAAAERYGLTPAIDRWVIENALRWLVSEADERERLALCSINLSGQSLGDDKFLPFVHRPVPPQRHRRVEDLLRDHRDRGDRELLAGQPLHPGAEGTRLQVRARRLRHRPVVVRLPEALPGGLPQDRRQLRQGNPARPDRPRDGPLDQRDRAPDRQADDRRVRRERRDHHDAARTSASITRRGTGSRRRSASPARSSTLDRLGVAPSGIRHAAAGCSGRSRCFFESRAGRAWSKKHRDRPSQHRA